MKLTPAEAIALSLVVELDGRTTGTEVGEILGISPRSGRRVLMSLVRKGALVKNRRGHYVAAERPDLATERPKMAVQGDAISSSTTNKYVLVVDPNGSTTKGAKAPLMGMVLPGKLNDDLPNPPKKTKQPRRDFHHLKPRSEWTMVEVAREFALLAHHAYPKRMYPVNQLDLRTALYELARDKDLTPEQALQAMEHFFSSDAHQVPGEVKPYRAFLNYLDRYLATKGADPSDLVAEFERRGEGRSL